VVIYFVRLRDLRVFMVKSRATWRFLENRFALSSPAAVVVCIRGSM